MLQHSCVRQSVLLPKQQQHRTPVIVCRHDLRKSANNAKERKLKRPKRIEERMMDPSLLLKAKSSIGELTAALHPFLLLRSGCLVPTSSKRHVPILLSQQSITVAIALLHCI